MATRATLLASAPSAPAAAAEMAAAAVAVAVAATATARAAAGVTAIAARLRVAGPPLMRPPARAGAPHTSPATAAAPPMSRANAGAALLGPLPWHPSDFLCLPLPLASAVLRHTIDEKL